MGKTHSVTLHSVPRIGFKPTLVGKTSIIYTFFICIPGFKPTLVGKTASFELEDEGSSGFKPTLVGKTLRNRWNSAILVFVIMGFMHVATTSMVEVSHRLRRESLITNPHVQLSRPCVFDHARARIQVTVDRAIPINIIASHMSSFRNCMQCLHVVLRDSTGVDNGVDASRII